MSLSPSLITKIVLFTLAVVVVFLTLHFDLLTYITLENIERYKQSLGWWAPLVFLIAFTLGELVHIPSVLWIFFAGVIWPAWLALPIALVSALSAATCSFLVARYFLGDQFHEKLPARFQSLNQKLEETPLRGMILLRLTTFMHPVMHWVLAASSIKLTTFLLGTLLGIFPLTLAIVMMGQLFLDWWNQYSNYIMGALVLAVVAFFAVRKRGQKRTSSLR